MKQHNVVTITLEKEVADWVRIEAARRQASVSRYVGEILREHMLSKPAYQVAMSHFLAAPTWSPARPGPLPTRDEVHDRRFLC